MHICGKTLIPSVNKFQHANSRQIYMLITYIYLLGHVHRQRAEGQRAQEAYENALKDGFVRVFRGQIQFVGQDRAGKTSLKKSLLGLRFDPKEQSTEGIEVDTSQCEIEVDEVKNWHSTHENKPALIECSKDIAKMVTKKLCQYGHGNFNFGEDPEESDLIGREGNESKMDQVHLTVTYFHAISTCIIKTTDSMTIWDYCTGLEIKKKTKSIFCD